MGKLKFSTFRCTNIFIHTEAQTMLLKFLYTSILQTKYHRSILNFGMLPVVRVAFLIYLLCVNNDMACMPLFDVCISNKE